MKYGIGIDTGGTFTDSVIVDFESCRLVSKAKTLTTKHDLSIGLENSFSALDTSLFPEVKLVSLSTTLATNSLVEGKGARVGLIISVPNESTFRVPSHVPADEVAVIRGAHNRQGDETAPLDLVAAGEAIRHMKNKVDAFAVSGYF
jgi:N-methylhydantoinase A/oxoprolinase/acetone carboxylase beta subunit